MTREEAVKELNALPAGGDNEASHGYADAILRDRLKALGEQEVVSAYDAARERCGFWYA